MRDSSRRLLRSDIGVDLVSYLCKHSNPVSLSDVKKAVQSCPPLQALDEPLLALLVWRAREQTGQAGDLIYTEGTPCDNTFGLLLDGELNITQRGKSIRTISEPALFGEVGFFESRNTRTATVEVSSPTATYLLFEIDPADLKSGPLQPLGKWLANQAWTTVVEDANRDR